MWFQELFVTALYMWIKKEKFLKFSNWENFTLNIKFYKFRRLFHLNSKIQRLKKNYC